MKTSKELEAEIERLKGCMSDIDNRLSDVEVRHPTAIEILQKETKAQEDKIKALEEAARVSKEEFAQLYAANNTLEDLIDRSRKVLHERIENLEEANVRRVRELNSQDEVLCGLQEKVEKLERQRKIHTENMHGAVNQDIKNLSNRLSSLESKPQDEIEPKPLPKCSHCQDSKHIGVAYGCVGEEVPCPWCNPKSKNYQGNKKQDSRREVIKRARALADKIECGAIFTHELTPGEFRVFEKVITIAEQSLEGGE